MEQRGAAPTTNYSIIANFLGVGNGFPGYTVPDAPPDTNMAVGDTSSGSAMGERFLHHLFQDFTLHLRPSHSWQHALGSTASLEPLCANNNDGDILAQFDRKADRWFLSQNVFVSPYAICIAISDTNDANGT